MGLYSLLMDSKNDAAIAYLQMLVAYRQLLVDKFLYGRTLQPLALTSAVSVLTAHARHHTRHPALRRAGSLVTSLYGTNEPRSTALQFPSVFSAVWGEVTGVVGDVFVVLTASGLTDQHVTATVDMRAYGYPLAAQQQFSLTLLTPHTAKLVGKYVGTAVEVDVVGPAGDVVVLCVSLLA
jgi:hypothetical protein